MTTATLTDIVIVMAVGVVITLVFGRLRLPTLVGLFVAGALVGPNALGLIENAEEVETLAEIGVVFLLFTLGLEFSFRRMLRLARIILVGGPLQVVLTGVIGFGVGLAADQSAAQSRVLGMLLALSSTAVVLKSLTERAQIDAPMGQNVLGILIFQDILVVPMMLVLPLLAGESLDTSWSPAVIAGAIVGIVALVIVGTKWVAPRLLYEAARSRSPDIFLMVVVTICFAVAALSARLGLSLALGAFLAGLIISESEYSHQAIGYIMPFRNLLVSFFFVSVGMLLDLEFLGRHWWMVLLGVVGLMLAKTVTGAGSVLALRYPLKVALASGMALSQVGEFSLVLAAVASPSLLSDELRQGLLAVAVLTMALTPVVLGRTDAAYRLVSRIRLPDWLVSGRRIGPSKVPARSGHLLIIGYGINGRNLARTAREFGIPYAVVEMNPRTVRDEIARDEPLYFGDATNDAVLLHAGVTEARAAAVVVGDPAATRGIVAQLRRLNLSLHIIARTRFMSEVQPLYALGADDVVPEEFETSIEIFRRTAEYFSLPHDEVERLEAAIREDHYVLLRRAQEDD